jgi:D-aspartate ligase
MNNRKEHFSILIPDGEHLHFLSYVLNCLSQKRNLKIYIMSDFKDNPFRYSRHVYNFSYYPGTSLDEEWVSNINKEVKKFDIDIIMPIYEEAIKKLVNNSHLIYENRLCVLPSPENFKIAFHKGLLTEHMIKCKIQSSKSVLVSPGTVFSNELIEFPVLIKPASDTRDGEGIIKFHNRDNLIKYFNENKFKFDYLVEEYIEGYDLGCSVLCNKGEILAFTIQKGFLWRERAYTAQIGLEFVYEPDLYNKIKNLMKSLKWSGIANIDLRYDERTDEFRVLEINPRFWATLDASLVAGVNFPYLYCLHSLGGDFEKPRYDLIKYLNVHGVLKSIKKNISFIFKFKFIFYNTQVGYILRDPIPSVYWFISKTRRLLYEKLKKF